MKSILLFIICLLYNISIAFSQQTIHVSPTDAAIQYIGRFDFSEKEKPVFMYSGCAIKTGFTGTSISILLHEDSLRNWFTVKLDDSLFIFKADKKDGVYLLVQHLADKNHTIEISRRTEWHGGNTTFDGFNIDEGEKLIPVEKKKRVIEFIGDSYTCGYGNEGKSREEHFTYETENNYATFGAITARVFNADYMTTCRSGIGMYQGYGGDTSFNEPHFYDEIVTKRKSEWDYKAHEPQVVVICLGANDLSASLDSARFVNAYIQFVQRLRFNYANAKIVCAAEPENSADERNKYQSYIKAVIDNFSTDKYIYYFAFSPVEFHGADWHPNLQEHQHLADELIPFIKKITKW